ncbi:MAG: dihydropteroate synthase [Elusimicrobiota bacterium]|nr:dihydropteroate synthase [Elusimicrobiota bacterium]
MLVVGEKINGMFKNVREAIQTKNKTIIQELAKKQLEAGAQVLDVNVGPASLDPQSDIRWLVESIRECGITASLAIDTTKPDVMDIGLTIAGKGSYPNFLNSINGEDGKLSAFLPIAKKHSANIIALTIDKSGIPAHSEGRLEIAAKIVAKVIEFGIETSSLYIDAVILPVNVAQQHSPAVLETIRQCKLLCDPPVKTILGLSNVSQGTQFRGLIDRTFLVMALAAGLDAAICNPLDKDLMDAMITAELLLGKNIYCDSFLEAYRK